MVAATRANQNGIPQARIVRYIDGVANPGFLLARSGGGPTLRFDAMFNDAYTEHINPPAGAPRPVPDPAVRTKTQSLPATLQSITSADDTLASRFTGQMRKVVQCDFSRGVETKFSHTWARTHGLLEYPQPHVSGSDAARESALRALRKYFVIEISSAGVYAAPVEYGIDCRRCAPISEYQLTPGAPLDLAAYYAANPTARVQRVLTAAQIAPAFAAGDPWYAGCGWAFSYSGLKAANVVQRSETDGYHYYRTQLLRLTFTVTLADEQPVTIVRFGAIARASVSPQPFAVGDVASVSGADQDEYNGARIVTAVDPGYFEYAVSGAPASPATGTIKVADITAAATVAATISLDAPGRVIFKQGGGGTLWVPTSQGQWTGVEPPPDRATVDGAVHVFYDGEEEIVTRWGLVVSNVARVESKPESSATWSGNATGTHAHETENFNIEACQSDTCEIVRTRGTLSASGSFTAAHIAENYGFYGPFDARVDAYIRSRGTSSTSPGASTEQSSQYGNNFILCPSCYWTDSEGATRTTASAMIAVDETIQAATNVVQEFTENAGGTSALILLYEEREAVAMLHATSVSETGRTQSVTARYRVRHAETKIDDNGQPFTNFDEEDFQFVAGPEYSSLTDFNNSSQSGSFMLRGTGGYQYSKTLTFDPVLGAINNLGFVGFERYVSGEKTTAESDLLFMRGGLFYDEPALTPRNQVGNRVYSIDRDLQTQGGFEALGVRAPIAFVGEV